ncbi:MAG: cation transporter [Clostridiales bacterium]|nr:cation transporter [Clostridiales bacterium]MCF8021557.1 cation transporter [Clostridiales bacterium]
MTNSINKTFVVGGLFSEEGVKEIEHNLIQIDGVEQVEASVNTGNVDIKYDPEVIQDVYIKKNLDTLGFSPRVFDEKQA